MGLADELIALLQEAYDQVATPADAASLLRDQREIRKAIDVMDPLLSKLIAESLPFKGGFIEGFGHVEVKKGRKRDHWQHDDLFRLVLARARDERRVDEETGEFEDLAEAALRVLRACAGNPTYWKVGELRDRGIDPDEFCESKPGKVSVILP